MSTLLDAAYITDKLGIDLPLIAVYDAPHDASFERVIVPVAHRRTCIFAYFNAWMRGQTLMLTSANCGCKDCSYWLLGKENRSRKDLIELLVGEEGVKCSDEIAAAWLNATPHYRPKHTCLYIGFLKNAMIEYLKTVTFFVTPDQLSALVVAANYHVGSQQVSPVEIPFGSGCMQLLAPASALEKPKAVLGASDLAMRKYLPDNVMAFTVNGKMFEILCSIDDNSFLNKAYLRELMEFRKFSKSSE
ncbi:DUF169 domain-containing protein [Saccharicrinis fermentans]|uniref:Putative ArCR n=1 Tax=Saccharicrinis fermentans DSM 9555 = JCM 21142 TaxID=869213 RepID=W7XWM0_9BACT|nr:DUF169 domain-containing protein [Saccharicrinis fermentans]GAF02745.1 putative ArCR [Saccharicrinis fermentans DSM 9555 = JCM 21142]